MIEKLRKLGYRVESGILTADKVKELLSEMRKEIEERVRQELQMQLKQMEIDLEKFKAERMAQVAREAINTIVGTLFPVLPFVVAGERIPQDIREELVKAVASRTTETIARELERAIAEEEAQSQQQQ